MVPEEFVAKWIEGDLRHTQVGYWVHTLNLKTGESSWKWFGEESEPPEDFHISTRFAASDEE